MQNKTFKLIGTSNLRFAKYIGQKIAVAKITRGDRRAKIETEKSVKGTTLVMSFKGDLYEFAS